MKRRHQQPRSGTREKSRLGRDTGEVASWLILAAGLAIAAGFAAVAMQRVGGLLTEEVADAAGVEIVVEIPPLPAYPGGLPAVDEVARGPDADPAPPGASNEPSTTADPTNTDEPNLGPNTDLAPPSTTADPTDETETLDSEAEPAPYEPVVRPPPGPVPAPGPVFDPVEPEPPLSATDAALALIQRNIDAGDDTNISEGELNRIHETLEGLTPEERELVLQQLSDEQLERLFHGVHADRRFRNNWDDKERAAFYLLLADLSQDAQQRLSEYTDYFDLYDSDLDPTAVQISEDAFVENYEAIINLPLDEFLALRAYMWDHPELLAESPFDWFADGCSVPGGHYPDGLNGPCLRHDFGYTNARQYALRWDPDLKITISDDPQAQAWKEHLDRQLGLDAHEAGHETWAGILYGGVATDFDAVGIPSSGRVTFESPYQPHYGPGFDPNLGQWPEEFNSSYRLGTLVDLATNGVS